MKSNLLNCFQVACAQLLTPPAALNWPHKDAAQILSLRILVVISDWLRDAAMTLYYRPLRHVPRTNKAGEMASCEDPGIPSRSKLIQSAQLMMRSGYSRKRLPLHVGHRLKRPQVRNIFQHIWRLKAT